MKMRWNRQGSIPLVAVAVLAVVLIAGAWAYSSYAGYKDDLGRWAPGVDADNVGGFVMIETDVGYNSGDEAAGDIAPGCWGLVDGRAESYDGLPDGSDSISISNWLDDLEFTGEEAARVVISLTDGSWTDTQIIYINVEAMIVDPDNEGVDAKVCTVHAAKWLVDSPNGLYVTAVLEIEDVGVWEEVDSHSEAVNYIPTGVGA